MKDDTTETPEGAEKFDYSAFPENTLFHERRGPDRRSRFPAKPAADSKAEASHVPKERRARKERRRRIDPTTFEKQYTDDELEFMNAMQQFKVQTCKSFPTFGDVLRVAYSLGYRKLTDDPSDELIPGLADDEPEPMLGLVSDSTDC
jgi:hypothetical protein